MTKNFPADAPLPGAGANSTDVVPVQSLAGVTYATALPSMVLGGYLLGALIVSSMRGDEDEWGIGPFVFVISLILIVVPGVAICLAQNGRAAERHTNRRSAWSSVGLCVAILAAIPAALIFLLIR